MKTLDVKAKEWFDRVNGNSYFSAQATVDFGLPTEKTVCVPFQYGYGSQYETETTHQLQTDGILPNDITIYQIGRYCRENGIVYRGSKQDKCLQREVKSFGRD